MKPKQNLFIASKASYVRGGRPAVTCILCGIIQGDPKVESLVVYQTQGMVVCMNLYPYSPGHVMIFPKRHIRDPRELTEAESTEIKHLMDGSMNILEKQLSCQGFNIGLNVGPAGGASIAHLHWHVVPRFRNEVGFIDIIGGSKIIIADPVVLRAELVASYENYFSPEKPKEKPSQKGKKAKAKPKP